MAPATPGPSRARELAHAVLLPGFAGRTVPPWLADALGSGLGGVCYFGHNLEHPDQVARLSASVHELGPAVIAVDEEGGIVTRLHAAEGSPHVGNAVLGRVDDVSVTRQVARDLAGDLRRAGVDLDLAPVVDVNANPRNPVIGVRSFGADPTLVARHGAAFVNGLQAAGIAACPKHFPGHGDTSTDSHVGLPVVDADLEQLRARELVPFAAVVRAGARALMTAHIVFAALDDAPATLSAPVLSLLRDELGFDGVVVSDAIDMQAISSGFGFGEGAVQALAAGVDLVALGNPVLGKDGDRHDEQEFTQALDAVVAALVEGRLPADRVEQAADRVRGLATWCRDARATPFEESAAERGRDGRAGAERSSVAIAATALRTRGEVAGTLTEPTTVLDLRRQRNIASGRLSGLVASALLERLPGSTARSVFASAGAEGRVTEADRAERAARDDLGDPDVVITGTPGRDDAESALLDRLLDRRPDTVVVCVGWSSDEHDLPGARRAVFTFGESRPTAEAVAQLLTGVP